MVLKPEEHQLMVQRYHLETEQFKWDTVKGLIISAKTMIPAERFKTVVAKLAEAEVYCTKESEALQKERKKLEPVKPVKIVPGEVVPGAAKP